MTGITEDELVKAICEHPDDDLPRLAYADWLDEHSTQRPGDPNYDRAEFIRLQMRLAAHQDEKGNPVEPEKWPEISKALSGKAWALHHKHHQHWLAPLRRLVPDAVFEFRRGMPESVKLTMADYIEHGRDIHRLAPITDASMHQGRPPVDVSNLAQCDTLGQLESLSIASGNFGDTGIAALARSPHLARLRTLALVFSEIGDEGVNALATSASLRNLRVLTLSHNNIGPSGARALSLSPNLAQVTHLNLASNGIGDNGTAFIAQSPYLSAVTSLDLGNNSISDNGIRSLAFRSQQKLTHLNLFGNQFGHRGARDLAQSPILGHVMSLWLGGNQLENAGILALAQSLFLRNLRHLNIAGCGYDNTGVENFAQDADMPNLNELDISCTNTGQSGILALINSARLSRLVTLQMNGVPVGDHFKDEIYRTLQQRHTRNSEPGGPP